MKKLIMIALAGIVCGCASTARPTGSIHDHRVAFLEFPQNPRLFRNDIRPYAEGIIRTHGDEEWQIVVLTSEFHTHLGIYSIIGAKMGLRAREYFGAGIDELAVISFAGRKPPVSCLSDGIQVSTGATLGHGTISVAEELPILPKAIFTHAGKSICLQLKEHYSKTVRSDIGSILKKYGLEDEEYWQAVRRLGIRYWLEWSRNDIFDLSVIKAP